MPNNSIFLSVLMCVYHEKEIWLKQSIESIINQTYTFFEFIIVLDDPKNSILENIIKKYKEIDNRIVLIKNDKNIGLTASLNKGLSLAKGNYIARMDSDDVCLPNRFEEQISLIDENIAVVGSQCLIINESDEKIGKTKFKLQDKKIKFYLKYMLPSISHPSALINRKFLQSVGGYDENFIVSQDYNLWCRLSLKANFKNVANSVLLLRKHNHNISKEKKILQLKNTIISNACLRLKLINPLLNQQYNQISEFIDNNSIFKFLLRLSNKHDNKSSISIKCNTMIILILSNMLSYNVSIRFRDFIH